MFLCLNVNMIVYDIVHEYKFACLAAFVKVQVYLLFDTCHTGRHLSVIVDNKPNNTEV